MDSYRLFFKKNAVKELRSVAHPYLRLIVQKIHSLQMHPRPVDAKILKGEDRYYRIRQGDYRIVYEINDKEQSVTVIKIGHRREVYD